MTEAMSAEFDTIAAWTAEVALDLGAEYYIPAACRGSAMPAALAWLGDMLDLSPTDQALDVGAGLGGPAAFLADRSGAQPILVEPEPGACHGASRLFGFPVVRADAGRLPIQSGTIDAAWCLGVLCTTDDPSGLVAELRRVLKPTGRLGLLVFTRTPNFKGVSPEGNHFITSTKLHAILRTAGLSVRATAATDVFCPEPEEWLRQAATLEAELDRRHSGKAAWNLALSQSETFGQLLATGQICSSLLIAHPADDRLPR